MVEQVVQGVCAGSIPPVFEACPESPEQPGLIPELELLWAGSWTADLLRSFPT